MGESLVGAGAQWFLSWGSSDHACTLLARVTLTGVFFGSTVVKRPGANVVCQHEKRSCSACACTKVSCRGIVKSHRFSLLCSSEICAELTDNPLIRTLPLSHVQIMIGDDWLCHLSNTDLYNSHCMTCLLPVFSGSLYKQPLASLSRNSFRQDNSLLYYSNFQIYRYKYIQPSSSWMIILS